MKNIIAIYQKHTIGWNSTVENHRHVRPGALGCFVDLTYKHMTTPSPSSSLVVLAGEAMRNEGERVGMETSRRLSSTAYRDIKDNLLDDATEGTVGGTNRAAEPVQRYCLYFRFRYSRDNRHVYDFCPGIPLSPILRKARIL